jgi:hypothetical protein
MRKIILVAGALANKPLNGGAAWTRLSWLLGLKKLGFETFFLEEIQPEHCVTKEGEVVKFGESLNLTFFREVMTQFGMQSISGLFCRETESFWGLSRLEVLDLAKCAVALVNISGQLKWNRILDRVPLKIYLDLDPGFTQIWAQLGNEIGLDSHDCFFSVGENLGRDGCLIPTGNRKWVPVRQPVLLDEWPVSIAKDQGRFTTVATWRGPFGTLSWDGKLYGSKMHEFRKVARLPPLIPQDLELALEIHPYEVNDLSLLKSNGWKLVDPKTVAADPVSFREYVQDSGGEFSVAQDVYVNTSSGWFSDRTVRYLASGKPVIVQDTGLQMNYPTGEGLLCYKDFQEAIECAKAIAENYSMHSRRAREIAECYFDAEKVLARFLEKAGLGL